MTGPRELTALKMFRALSGAGPLEQQAAALTSLAVSLAALADLYELELACLEAPDGDDERDDVSEAYPS